MFGISLGKKKKEKIVPQVKRGNGGNNIIEKTVHDTGKKKAPGKQESVFTDFSSVITGSLSGGNVPSQVRDPGKRQRVIAIAAIISVLLFVIRVWGSSDWVFWGAVYVAVGAALLTYVGLIWAFRFQLNRRGYTVVLPQPAMYAFSAVLFVEIFFFQEFERIYESLIFGLLLLALFVSLVTSFLTANVLNVATIKKIPLIRVAHTSSYIISLLITYFISFSAITSGLDVWFLIPILAVTYLVVCGLHLAHFPLIRSYLIWYSVGIALSAVMLVSAFLFWPLSALMVALIPTVVIYVGLGIIMHKLDKTLNSRLGWEFGILIGVVLVLFAIRAKWGIGGYFWS
ncbi:hypothetical protein JW710_00160 [Candidatus Dojkabacteria bacterium]|nr:hypothetical protein [Candidatus Dojkabacteria bacterium]